MIKTMVIGHLGKDALVKDVNGKIVINFSVAHSEKFKNYEGIQMEKTLWVECAYWTEKTTIAQYLTKGTQVFVEGQPSIDTYTNAQGQTNAVLRLRVGQIQLLGSRQETGQSAQTYNQPNRQPEATNEEPADDLPF